MNERDHGTLLCAGACLVLVLGFVAFGMLTVVSGASPEDLVAPFLVGMVIAFLGGMAGGS